MGTMLMLLVSAAAAVQPAPRVSPVDLAGAMRAERVQLVLVKDFLRLENTGRTLPAVEFERYLPACDTEQFVAARWAEASTDGGTKLDIRVASVREDEAGNLIQRLEVRPLPGMVGTRVTLSSVVVRRERPGPPDDPAIPAPEAYPDEVRPYLEETAMVARDHELVAAAAQEILKRAPGVMSVAREIERLARTRAYLPAEAARADMGLPTAAFVLRHGGSCCGSAVAAAAVLRRCGIPAQITYAPAGYVHGIVRFWVPGHGWVRMDATSGSPALPLVSAADDLRLVRLFDMPIEMEHIWYAYAWPYLHNDGEGEYRFRSNGQVVEGIRFASADEAQARAEGRVAGWVVEPFPHLEPGSWATVMGSEPTPADWDRLWREARDSMLAGREEPQDMPDGFARYLEAGRAFGRGD